MKPPRTPLLCTILLAFAAFAGAQTWPVPPEIASTHFTVTLNGQSTPAMHAASNIDFLNFPAAHNLKVTVTADRDGQWSKGVEIEPWRLGIRPKREGRTISFTLDGPAKISITQPNDVLADAPTLYLFANPPEQNAPKPGAPNLRYIAPGAHTENIDAQSGDNIYLAPGAVVFGSLNLWQVDHVHVFGRGVIVYDGPQNPADDDGWMHRKNWHCIVMDNAHDISIEGITCVVRSRTWQIQMKDSRNILFDNIKVIGANSGNANADGMDWLGGGDTVVRNSFFRAADDVFSMESSWEGYGDAAFAVQGNPVTNITVEDSVLSTSISNIVRAGWPRKNFTGGHFTLRNSDVTQMGMGGCGIPFALMEFWADPLGRGQSSNFAFDNIRLEHWTSLTQLMQPANPSAPDDGLSHVSFTNISALELPSLVPSVLKGAIHDVSFANLNLAGNSDTAVLIQNGAAAPTYASPQTTVRIVTPTGLVRPNQKITFEAVTTLETANVKFDWTFGDGTHASGRKVKHKFPDAAGTLLDDSGRFRVIVHAIGPGLDAYTSTPIIVTNSLQPAAAPATQESGLNYTYAETGSTAPATTGTTQGVATAPIRRRPENYTLTFNGFVNIPADGGYTFTLEANDTSAITLDGKPYTTPKPFAQVCDLAGNAPQTVTVSAALAKGSHTIQIAETHTTGDDNLRLLWQPPNQPVTEVPASAYSH